MYIRDCTHLPKSRNRLQIPDPRRETCSKFRTENPHTLGSAIQNLVVLVLFTPAHVTLYEIYLYVNIYKHDEVGNLGAIYYIILGLCNTNLGIYHKFWGCI